MRGPGTVVPNVAFVALLIGLSIPCAALPADPEWLTLTERQLATPGQGAAA